MSSPTSIGGNTPPESSHYLDLEKKDSEKKEISQTGQMKKSSDITNEETYSVRKNLSPMEDGIRNTGLNISEKIQTPTTESASLNKSVISDDRHLKIDEITKKEQQSKVETTAVKTDEQGPVKEPIQAGSQVSSPLSTMPLQESTLKAQKRIGETWMEMTESLLKITPLNEETFKSALPEIAKQLVDIGHDVSWIKLWGKSLNFDGYKKTQIVHSDLIKIIGELSGWQEKGNKEYAYHAGLLHTFGYLFSNVEPPPPFGYKRDRWINEVATKGLGLPDDVWSPYPPEGNFMANMSFIAASIAFRGLNWQDRIASLNLVSPELREYDFSKLKIKRIEEKIEINEPGREEKAELTIYTDLVRFPHSSESPSTYLLVYSLKDSREHEPKLITMFPVDDKMDQRLTGQESGEVNNVRLSYNAISDNVEENQPLKGTRLFIPETNS